MLAIKIDNPEIENKFKEYAKKQKKSLEDLVSDALKLFLDLHKKDDELIYAKKDPMKHLHKIKYDYDEEFCDEVALTHIEDSAKYIHDLRRKRKYE
ncbi:MAG TPA: hypothetical protein CFH84_12250 [Sulfurimonas sp. UBA12504]|nr:MAG: hypothetical protein A2019_00800 [Sulfurimonas sp. GWF2_37_8]DAB28938.1 MAG TPA: hypothetical protein CFH84_12250 [Sulfurimonas sp. UBA12504]